MLHYVWSKLPSFGSGSRQEDRNEYSVREEGRSSEYPQYVSPPKPTPDKGEEGLISKKFDASLTLNDSQDVKEEEKDEDNEEKEVVKSRGMITRLDEMMPKGLIDRTYFFDIATYCKGNNNFRIGSVVDFEAFRSRSCPAWVVTSMKLYVSPKEEQRKEATKHRTLVVKVERVEKEFIHVKWADNKFLNIPKAKGKLPSHPIRKGDWLKIHFEQIFDEAEQLHSDETMSNIVSIEPNQQKTIVGKITIRGNEMCVDNEIYVTLDVVKGGRAPPEGTLVRCIAVDSTQKSADPKCPYQWRAVDIQKSYFLQYTRADSDTGNKESESDEQFWNAEVSTIKYAEMYENRGGIQIIPPKFIKFPAAKIGTCITKTVSIRNLCSRTIPFVKLDFVHDSSVCRFECEFPRKEMNIIQALAPSEVYNFSVICTPLQMGKTKEIGVFDFGDFRIVRDFIVIGLTNEEGLLDKIRKPDDGTVQRPSYRRIRGSEEIGVLMQDNERIRIRGPAPVRAPFFKAFRMDKNYGIPKNIWESYQNRDESILKAHYRHALNRLSIQNYQLRFDLALWFEEVENDIRRRQFDVRGVRLKQSGEFFTFTCPYIQDIQPPVMIGDGVEVLDPAEPSGTKFQGFIKKIMGTEVFVLFGETFTGTYGGIPMTVRFCLGRMTYKRQHFAIEKALQILGAEFLFPFGFVEYPVQVPRIPFFEAQEVEISEETMEDTANTKNEPDHNDAVIREAVEDQDVAGLFLTRQRNGYKNLGGYIGNPSVCQKDNRRAPSLRTPFVSDVAVSKFLKDVKLTWFNKTLNEEQRNAVRRILRGQARPLPYIIFGPPGTGKTVTVVEAIMQVNKLDPNSRVLVTAPTNHAADVIADNLVRSGRYHPGEFVRLNGFLRQEQIMMDSIKEYCVDGEFLDSVARHRLIIATCTTAGQFFNLNLTPGHFTHVFIDEAGYCTEPETMIAAVNLALDKGGQLILAGDHKQLGPVLMSDVAQNLDLNLSYLERLMQGNATMPNIYSRRSEIFGDDNFGYNPLVLTKLVRNYRANKTLLKLPSRLFYDDDLVSCASHNEAYALTQDPDRMERVLHKPGVPIIFHGVQGTSIREHDSPSWYNAAEVMHVVSYVRKLKSCEVNNDDIGIIAPYRKQCEKLRLAMQMSFLEDETPKVGSVEEFQGGERQVIIITTVRSLLEEKVDTAINKLGFIFNEKRFNVAITRAKSLMIVVGNPHVLCRDAHWNQLLRYCLELGVYTGCNLPHELDEVVKDLHQKMLIEEASLNLQTLPSDIPNTNYNPEGLDEDELDEG